MKQSTYLGVEKSPQEILWEISFSYLSIGCRKRHPGKRRGTKIKWSNDCYKNEAELHQPYLSNILGYLRKNQY